MNGLKVYKDLILKASSQMFPGQGIKKAKTKLREKQINLKVFSERKEATAPQDLLKETVNTERVQVTFSPAQVLSGRQFPDFYGIQPGRVRREMEEENWDPQLSLQWKVTGTDWIPSGPILPHPLYHRLTSIR